MGDECMARRTRLAVVMHADVVGSTRMVQRDEQAAHEQITQALSRLARTVSRYGGHAHEVRGDAMVAKFARPSDGIAMGEVIMGRYMPPAYHSPGPRRIACDGVERRRTKCESRLF